MTQKVIISKPNYNALTETDPDNLIFSSDYNTLKYYLSGNLTVTVDFADYYIVERDPTFGPWYYHRKEETVTHNLGYKPFFIVYTEGLVGKFSMCPYIFSDAGHYTLVQAYTDTTKLYFVIEARNTSPSGSGGGDFYYKIFKNDTGL